MSYIEDNLNPGEKILFSAKVHTAVLLPSFLLFIFSFAFLVWGLGTASKHLIDTEVLVALIFFTTAIMFLLAALEALTAFLRFFTTEFAITNRKVVAKTGLIQRHTLEILLSKVESISVRQDILGRILNYGNMTVVGTGLFIVVLAQFIH